MPLDKVKLLASLDEGDLRSYVEAQLRNHFPVPGRPQKIPGEAVQAALERVRRCFWHIRTGAYCSREEGRVYFNHMYSDQNLCFLYYLSNTLFRDFGDKEAATAVYYLNKALHAFDCMYDTDLPEVFMVAHGVGVVLGKARYGNFFFATSKVTVGAHAGEYPVLDDCVGLGAGSAVIGGCALGKRVSVGAGTTLFRRSVPADHGIWRNDAGAIVAAPTDTPLAARAFYL